MESLEEKKYWLKVNNPKMIAEYGPFQSREFAWKYYFGRNFSKDELAPIIEAGWQVIRK